MNKCPSWLTWLYLAMIIPFPFIDASPIRNLGTFTKMVPGTFALLLALGLVPEAIYEEENHSVEHITTFQSIIFHLK